MTDSDSKAKEMIGMSVNGVFRPLPDFSHRVRQAWRGGLMISHVTPEDAGSYAVEVEGRDDLPARRHVNLLVVGK